MVELAEYTIMLLSQDVKNIVNIKVALSSLQFNIIELVLVARDKGCLWWGTPNLLIDISWVKKV